MKTQLFTASELIAIITFAAIFLTVLLAVILGDWNGMNNIKFN